MPALMKRVCYKVRNDKAIAWSVAKHVTPADTLFLFSARSYPSTKGITTGSSNAVMRLHCRTGSLENCREVDRLNPSYVVLSHVVAFERQVCPASCPSPQTTGRPVQDQIPAVHTGSNFSAAMSLHGRVHSAATGSFPAPEFQRLLRDNALEGFNFGTRPLCTV